MFGPQGGKHKALPDGYGRFCSEHEVFAGVRGRTSARADVSMAAPLTADAARHRAPRWGGSKVRACSMSRTRPVPTS